MTKQEEQRLAMETFAELFVLDVRGTMARCVAAYCRWNRIMPSDRMIEIIDKAEPTLRDIAELFFLCDAHVELQATPIPPPPEAYPHINFDDEVDEAVDAQELAEAKDSNR